MTPKATSTAAAAAPRAASVAKPFTPAKHTLMLTPEELASAPAPALAEPAAPKPAGPSPFAAALTR